MKSAIEVVLPDKRVVHVVELEFDDLEKVFALADKVKGEGAQNLRRGREGLQYSIRNIDGKPFTYNDITLAGGVTKLFSVKEILILIKAWDMLHSPTEEEADLGNARVTSTG